MKCIDCKFCAFINKDEERITVIKSSGAENHWATMKGAFCMKISCLIDEVIECTGYEKSKHKKQIQL